MLRKMFCGVALTTLLLLSIALPSAAFSPFIISEVRLTDDIWKIELGGAQSLSQTIQIGAGLKAQTAMGLKMLSEGFTPGYEFWIQIGERGLSGKLTQEAVFGSEGETTFRIQYNF